MNQSNRTVFVCDDNADTRELITFAFQLKGYEVVSCDNLEECLSGARAKTYQAIILDNRFGQTTSLEVCKEIRNFDSEIPIIFFSGEVRESEIDKAKAAGATAYLIKPNDFEKLVSTTLNLIGNPHNAQNN